MSTSKYFILTADDFAMAQEYDRAILEGFTRGFLTSACICANGKSYEYAINTILPKCPHLDLGVHLNIVEGKSLSRCPLLTDDEGNFKYGFLSLFLKSFDKKILSEIEQEFRAQIEKLKKDTDHPITFINSHVHIHAIPAVFKICAKLAKEYDIKFVRTQAEKFYRAKHSPKSINILKVLILNYFSAQNRATVKKYNLLTNNYILGVGFTGEMTGKTLSYGAKSLEGIENIIVEALIHPGDDKTSPRYNELQAALDLSVKEDIEKAGFKLCAFKNLLKE